MNYHGVGQTKTYKHVICLFSVNYSPKIKQKQNKAKQGKENL